MAENIEFNILGNIDLSNVMSGLSKAKNVLDNFANTAGGILKGGTINIKQQAAVGKTAAGGKGILEALAPIAMMAGGIAILAKASGRFGSMIKGIIRLLMLFLKPIGDLLAAFLRPLYLLLKPFIRQWNKIMRPLARAMGEIGKKIASIFSAEGMGGVVDYIKSLITPAMEVIGTYLIQAGEFIWGVITSVFNEENFMMVADFIVSTLSSIGDFIAQVDWVGIFGTLGTYLLDTAVGAIKAGLKVLEGLGALLATVIKEVSEFIKKVDWLAVFNYIANALIETGLALIDTGLKQLETIGPALKELLWTVLTNLPEVLMGLGKLVWDLLVAILPGALSLLWNLGGLIVDLILTGLAGIGWIIANGIIGLINSIISIATLGLGPQIPYLGANVLGSRKEGGYIPQTGLYKLHAGENVIPAGQSTMNINVTGAEPELQRMIERTVESYMRTQYTNY